MDERMMFSREKWGEPIREDYYQESGGVVKKWRKKIGESMKVKFLPGKRIKYKISFEVQEEYIRKQLIESMADKKLPEIRQKQILSLADFLINFIKNSIEFRDVLDEQLKMEQFESEYPLKKYSTLNHDLLESLLDRAEMISDSEDFNFLKNFAIENNDADGMGAMNLMVVYDFKVV